MSLLRLLREDAGSESPRIIISAVLAGVANVVLLATINAAAHAPATVDIQSLFLYAVSVAAFVINTRYTTHRITEIVENLIERTKLRIGEKLVRIELEALERVKGAEVCTRITDNLTIITDRVGRIATMIQSAFLVGFALMYVIWVAPAAFVVIALVCIVGGIKFQEVRRDLMMATKAAAMDRIRFLERMTDLLGGIKELQFGRRRRRDVRENVLEASSDLKSSLIKVNNLSTDGALIANSILFFVLAGVIFTLQQYMPLDAYRMLSVVSAVLFLWGPFMGFIWGFLPYLRSDVAMQEVLALETKLEKAARETIPEQNPKDPWTLPRHAIRAENVEYEYGGEDGADAFHVGPVNLQIEPGEIVFIVGGNGSGKSTLLKVLTGLYWPTGGSVVVDDIPVRRDNVVAYRNKISSIFSDFHLFAKLHGIDRVDERTVGDLLTSMRLDGQTAFVDRAFTKLSLSTGQKKRLALVVALLENRPICTFDEWAADQDPEFRRYFYEELLPALRKEGKTVFVASHDDRYFHCADKVVTMEYGKIRSVDIHTHSKEVA
jgi:putative ATP-binding cassette transporter